MAGPTYSFTDAVTLSEGILSGDRAALARAITISESTREDDRQKTEEVLKKILPSTGKSIRIGITGVPGVGKSTFIEIFGELLTQEGKEVAVLTIDPTSQVTKGSILGDKTRMDKLSRNPNVFIRPSPSNLTLGGVSNQTREAILLCEAAGFDIILIETVGVGQSETDVRNMVDFFLLLMLAGAGDELQGIKKGIMEMADGIVITKTDGDNKKAARQAQADVSHAIQFQAKSSSGWKPKVLTASAVDGLGIAEVWKMIQDYVQHTSESSYFSEQRLAQKTSWLDNSVESHFRNLLRDQSVIKKREQLTKKIAKDQLLPSEAAKELWTLILKTRK